MYGEVNVLGPGQPTSRPAVTVDRDDADRTGGIGQPEPEQIVRFAGPILDSAGRPGPCPTNVLRLGPGASNGAGGTNYLTYSLTNAGTASCTLFGYPGVSVLDANRHQVQQPAVRAPQLAPTGTRLGQVTLAPGAEAFFVLSVIDTDPDPDCPNPRTGTELRVFPPNQTAPILQPGQFQACQAHVSYVFTR